MKTVNLEPARDVKVVTPQGTVVVARSNPFNGTPETFVYFTDSKNMTTKTYRLGDLVAYLNKD